MSRVAVVTGGGRGIGRAMALALARRGDRVVIAARTSIELEETARAIRDRGGAGEAVVVDLGAEESPRTIFERAHARFGPVTLLINNAGSLVPRPLPEVADDELDRTLSVNLRAAYLCSRFAFTDMRDAGGGCIITVASLSGVAGVEKFPGLSAYVISKFGLVGLTEALAVEGRPAGIHAVGLAPGAVDTALLRQAVPGLQAGVTPEQVARLLLFIDRYAARLTGLTLPLFSNR